MARSCKPSTGKEIAISSLGYRVKVSQKEKKKVTVVLWLKVLPAFPGDFSSIPRPKSDSVRMHAHAHIHTKHVSS